MYGSEYQLRATSVEPLIRLMKERNVTQLTAVRRRWHLTSDGVFANPDSGEAKQGRVEDLQNRGNVFNMQNLHINPHFRRTPQQELSEDQQEQRSQIPRDDSNVVKFRLERDLQRALRNNISQLEPGLKVVDGGTERTVEAGRIDVIAEDTQGKLVVIESKLAQHNPRASPNCYPTWEVSTTIKEDQSEAYWLPTIFTHGWLWRPAPFPTFR